MLKVRLTKISKNPNALRTDVVEGEAPALPVAGQDFLMYAPPLESGMVRYIRTSQVRETYEDGTFHTLNSVYRLEVLP